MGVAVDPKIVEEVMSEDEMDRGMEPERLEEVASDIERGGTKAFLVEDEEVWINVDKLKFSRRRMKKRENKKRRGQTITEGGLSGDKILSLGGEIGIGAAESGMLSKAVVE